MKDLAVGNRLFDGRICDLLAERSFVSRLRMTVIVLLPNIHALV